MNRNEILSDSWTARGAFLSRPAKNGTPRGARPRIARRSLTAVPTLVIGVGGTGLKVTRHLRKILRLGDASHVEIVDLDTDLREGALSGKGWVDHSFVDLRVARLAPLLNQPERHPSLAFVPDGFQESRIWIGAGQKPINGALAFYLNQTRVADRLRAALTRLLELRPPGQQELDTSLMRIVVVASSAGGTGRGALIPLAQCLRDIVEDAQGTSDTHVSVEAYVLLPSCFSDVLKQQNLVVAKANAFGQLIELSLLDEHPGSWPYRFPGSTRDKRLTNPPFDRIVLVDRRTQTGEVASLDDLYAFLAELLWLQIEKQTDESLLTDSLSVNVPDRTAYGKPARYQAVGGHVLKFDADRVVGYAVPRYVVERVVAGVLLDAAVAADAVRRVDLVDSYEAVRTQVEEAGHADDVLARDRRLREEQLTGEFARAQAPADLAWVGADASAGLDALRARFAAHLTAAAQRLGAAACVRLTTAFDAAAERLVGGLPACRTQLARVVRDLREELERYGEVDIGPQERESEVALAQLGEGPALGWLRRYRTRARFRRWFAAYRSLAAVIREAELHTACRRVLAQVLAAAEALLSKLGAAEAYLRQVRAATPAESTESAHATASAIMTSAVPASADPAIYESKLLPGSDPLEDVRQTLGSFAALLRAADADGWADLLDATTERVETRFRHDLAKHDIFELCAEHGGPDVGRWIAEALHVRPFISIDRAKLGERDEGSVTIVSVPRAERAAVCDELQGGEITVHRSDNPHRVVVMKAYTSLPLFALANLDDLATCYHRILAESKRNPARFPHIHKDIPGLGFTFEPRREQIVADLAPVEGLDHDDGDQS